MSPEKDPLATLTVSRKQMIFVSWTKDVLIYIIVLNLFVEYVEKVVIDSFTISIFTAILLKALLDVILGLEHKVAHFFEARAPNLEMEIEKYRLNKAKIYTDSSYVKNGITQWVYR